MSYRNEKKRRDKLRSILRKRQRVVNIAKEQYKAGAVTQLDLLVAQQDQLEAENNFVISESTVAQNAVVLYQAFGLIGEEEKHAKN